MEHVVKKALATRKSQILAPLIVKSFFTLYYRFSAREIHDAKADDEG
jgi:hypothetical protein